MCAVLLGICGFVGISRSRKSQKLRRFHMCVSFSLGSVDSLKFLFLALVEKLVCAVLLGICGFVEISSSRTTQKLTRFNMCVSFSLGSVDSLKLLFFALVEKIVCAVLLGICGFVGISRSRKSQKLRRFHMCVSFSLGSVDSLKFFFLALVE